VSYTAAAFWLSIAQWAFTVAVGAYCWLVTRQRATQHQMREAERRLHQRIDTHETRISRVESRVEHLPGHEDLADVRECMQRVAGDVRALREAIDGNGRQLKALERSVARINDYLLDQKP